MQTCQDDELLDHLKRFQQHAVAHFDQELEWMKSTDFPSTDCHDDEHKAVLASVQDVLTKLEAGDVALARSLVQALVDWFPGHADYLDSALALWMVKRRKGGAPVVIRRTIASANIPDSP
jgi:hemerythrin